MRRPLSLWCHAQDILNVLAQNGNAAVGTDAVLDAHPLEGAKLGRPALPAGELLDLLLCQGQHSICWNKDG
jgi:hypothetical protein